MQPEQSLQAITRIEAALERLEAASERAPDTQDADLARRHEALRQNVRLTLSELDVLIGALEK